MLWGTSKTRSTEPPPQLGDDASATALLECVVQEMAAGRARNEIAHELVRHRWERAAATRFCHLAQEIAKEVRQSPDQRAVCARRGMERIQASYGWIGSGLLIAVMLWVGGPNLQRFAPSSLLVVGYGLVELISGLALWWPHKDFLTDKSTDSKSKTVR